MENNKKRTKKDQNKMVQWHLKNLNSNKWKNVGMANSFKNFCFETGDFQADYLKFE